MMKEDFPLMKVEEKPMVEDQVTSFSSNLRDALTDRALNEEPIRPQPAQWNNERMLKIGMLVQMPPVCCTKKWIC